MLKSHTGSQLEWQNLIFYEALFVKGYIRLIFWESPLSSKFSRSCSVRKFKLCVINIWIPFLSGCLFVVAFLYCLFDVFYPTCPSIVWFLPPGVYFPSVLVFSPSLRDFLPRGSGIVTRRPLILQLVNCKTGEYVLSWIKPTAIPQFPFITSSIWLL